MSRFALPFRTSARAAGFALATACVITCSAAAPAFADVSFPARRDLVAFRAQNSYRSWTVKDAQTGEKHKVRQFASRWFNTWTASEDLQFVLYSSAGRSEVRGATVDHLAGMGDVRGKAFLHLMDRRVVATLGVALPTGVTNLTTTETSVLEATSSNVLGFRMRSFGGGFTTDLGLAGGHELSESTTIGGGVSYLIRGAYDLDATTEYNAGDELALNAGLDMATRTLNSHVDVVYRMFGQDEWNGDPRFEQGDQLEVTLTSTFRQGRAGLDLFARNVSKDDNQQMGPDSVGQPSETRIANGNTFWLEVAPMYQPTQVVAFRGVFEYLAANQAQQQSIGGWSIGAGGGVDLRLTRFTIAQIRVLRLRGESEDGTVERSGLDGILTLAWQY